MNIMKKFRLVFKTSTIIFLTNFRYPFNSPINSPIFLQKSEPFFPPGHHLIFICHFILSIMTDIEYAAIFQFFAENKQYPPLSSVNFCGKSH